MFLKVCVKECPASNWVFLTGAAIETASSSASATERKKMLCKDGINAETSSKVVPMGPNKTWWTQNEYGTINSLHFL